MKVLVTGATGFIGFHVGKLLVEKGFHVRALVRNEWDASFLEDAGMELVAGDIRDIDTIYNAMRGCRQLYHLAADNRLWVPDPKTMYDINVHGTRNVLHAALMLSVEKVVYSGTAGTLAPGDGTLCTEDTPVDIRQMAGHHKTTRFIAEREAEGFRKKGLPVVIVNPATPIGPMDRKPTRIGRTIVNFLNNRIHAYLDTGLNLVDVEDAAEGHLLAARHGKIGERYLLGNRNTTLGELFELLAVAARKRVLALRLPYLPVLVAAYFNEAISRWVSGKRPRIPLAAVREAKQCIRLDCSKAVTELQLPQRPIEPAIARAVDWFEKNGYVRST